MQILYNNSEYVQKLVSIAKKEKTVYGWGAIGAPASYGNNKSRYKVPNAPDDSFIFDCSGFAYKALPLGWYGDHNRVYGGADPARYPELYNCNDILSMCSAVSDDFSKILPGEVLYMSGHVGLYIGNGKAVECTSAWKGGCLFSEVQNCNIDTGLQYKRTWLKHGRLPFVSYSEPTPAPTPDNGEIKEELTDLSEKLLKIEDEIGDVTAQLDQVRGHIDDILKTL